MTDLCERLRRIGHPNSTEGRVAMEAVTEIERLQAIMNPEVTYRDLELKMRDGGIDLRAVLGEGSEPAMRWLAALMWHAILGDGNEEPDNYRSARFSIKPSGEFRPIQAYIEIIKPGGRSSHEIRSDLEAELAQLRPAS